MLDIIFEDMLRAWFSRSCVDERKFRKGTGHLRSDDGRQSCETFRQYVY